MLLIKLALKSLLQSKLLMRLPALLEEEYYQEAALEFDMIDANFESSHSHWEISMKHIRTLAVLVKRVCSHKTKSGGGIKKHPN